MARSSGKILFIGVTHVNNTMVHLAESIAAPYCGLNYNQSWGDTLHVKLSDSSVVEHKQTKFPGCSGGFDIIDEVLADKRLAKLAMLNLGWLTRAT